MNEDRNVEAPDAGIADGPRARWSLPGSLGVLVEDHQFRVVVLVLIACVLGHALFMRAYGSSLPWCDEWFLTSAASGQEPMTWEWFWRPANEHSVPLTRLAVVIVGQLGSWDWQLNHAANLVFMGLGSFALIVAARAIRGRSQLSDAFLCLLALSPWHYATITLYGFAYAFACGLICLAISLAAARWPFRSVASQAV
jgi:hypothetical protein